MHVDRDAIDRPGPAAGLLKSLSKFAGTLIAIAHTRIELLTTELQQEVRRIGAILLWALIAAFAAMMALLLGALAVIFFFWETHRGAASLAVIAGFLGIAAAAVLVLRRKLRSKPPLLADTLAELANDRDQLRARL
ncbi:MAG TPA: phage holin family protein [Steroidobacter sp.]|nr:phage holin family protein [Steroidobacter sp.]